jgi:hypothetical protein
MTEMPNISNGEIYSNKIVKVISEEVIQLSGLQTGKITVIKKNDTKIMLKIAGHNDWAGRGGLTSYSPPEYLVGYYIDGRFSCIKAIEYNKSSMKKARELADKCFDELIV